MDSAVELIFLVSAVGEAIGEMLHTAGRMPMIRAADCHHDATNRAREPGIVQHGANFLLHGLGIVHSARMPNVEVNGNLVIGRNFRDQR